MYYSFFHFCFYACVLACSENPVILSCAEMKDIASTALLKARLAKYKDSIASAMQAQFSNILQEVSFAVYLSAKANIVQLKNYCITESHVSNVKIISV